MKPNFLPTTTPDSQIQENPSISHTEQPHQPIPTIPGLPNPNWVDPSLMPFLTLFVSMTAKALVPWIAARLKPQKPNLKPDEKGSIVFNFSFFNRVVNIKKGNDN